MSIKSAKVLKDATNAKCWLDEHSLHEAITDAIECLNSPKGSTKEDILEYILARRVSTKSERQFTLKLYHSLENGVDNGTLTFNQKTGSFKLSKKTKVCWV